MSLSKSAVRRILETTGLRVSNEAVEEFSELLEEIIIDIASEALAKAKEKNRKTVTAEDVKEIRKLFV